MKKYKVYKVAFTFKNHSGAFEQNITVTDGQDLIREIQKWNSTKRAVEIIKKTVVAEGQYL